MQLEAEQTEYALAVTRTEVELCGLGTFPGDCFSKLKEPSILARTFAAKKYWAYGCAGSQSFQTTAFWRRAH